MIAIKHISGGTALNLVQCLDAYRWGSHTGDTYSKTDRTTVVYGPRQANLVLIAYASSEGSGEPAHPRSLARTFAAR